MNFQHHYNTGLAIERTFDFSKHISKKIVMNQRMPWWLTLIIIILAITVIGSIIGGIVYGTTYEKETKESDTKHEEGKAEQNDESIEVHIERHKIDKEYEKNMEEARMEHEIYKSSIIGPCSAIALGMVCTLLYFLLKPRMGNAAPLNKKHDLKNQTENEHENGNHIRIPKSKVRLVEALTMMGYEKKKFHNLLNKTTT